MSQNNSEGCALAAGHEQEAITECDGVSISVEVETRYNPIQPPVFGAREHWQTLVSRLPEALPETRIVLLKDAWAVGTYGWVVTPSYRVLPSLSWYQDILHKTPLKSVRWKTEVYLAGDVLNLASMSAQANYGHFLLDSIGRLALLRDADIDLDTFSAVIVPKNVSKSGNELLERAGVRPEQIIHPIDLQAIRAERLWTPSLVGTTRTYRAALPHYLRSLLRESSPSSNNQKIFISRPEARRPLLNALSVETMLRDEGFTIVDPVDCDLPNLIAHSSCVVGAHGAGLADIAFASPGTRVVEMLPSDHMYPYFYSLAIAADLDYRAVIGDSEVVRPLDAWGPSPHGFTVAEEELQRAINSVNQEF